MAEVGSLWITLNYERVRNGVAPLGYPLPHSWPFTTVNGVQEFLVDDPCSASLRPKNWGLRMKRYGFREMRRINSVPTRMNRHTGLNISRIITGKHSHVKHLRLYIFQASKPVKHSAKVFSWSVWTAIPTQGNSPCLRVPTVPFPARTLFPLRGPRVLCYSVHMCAISQHSAPPYNLRGSRCAVAHMCTDAQLAEECFPTRTIPRFSSTISCEHVNTRTRAHTR
jgi:hypothetical protein